MFIFKQVVLAFKAMRELGLKSTSLYGLYRLALRSGYYRFRTKIGSKFQPDVSFHSQINNFMLLPNKEQIDNLRGDHGNAKLIADAEAIKKGRILLFNGESVALDFTHPEPLLHWSEYKDGWQNDSLGEDIKFIWEPARFGWAYTLARAYHLTGDESYCEAFWSLTETFLENNPPNLGFQWISGQEAALRIIAFTFAWNVFANSPASTPYRQSLLSWAIACHAERIPPTLIYARAQNNNHLLSEAAGLYTASISLPDHPQASRWKRLGLRWFCDALNQQIAEDGTYIQQSTNYHRLMLQLALWMGFLMNCQGESYLDDTLGRLRAATLWLYAIMDPISGEVPNLGPNDGALIQPLDSCEFSDYRPVLQATSVAYLEAPIFPTGIWDEPLHWLSLASTKPVDVQKVFTQYEHGIQTYHHKVSQKEKNLWAYLRVPQFKNRPGHADLLHLDIWWQGYNVAKDAGTYRYRAPLPWDNSLAGTNVHNTLTVDEMDQMKRAGRFLWLDWAQGRIIERIPDGTGAWASLTAEHNGYHKLGLVHRRRISLMDGSILEIFDQLLPFDQPTNTPHDCYINWLVPDWHWEILSNEDDVKSIQLRTPKGDLFIKIMCAKPENQIGSKCDLNLQITRAGELICGRGQPNPIFGWYSPTYGCKLPALSIRASVHGIPPLEVLTTWQFPDTKVV